MGPMSGNCRSPPSLAGTLWWTPAQSEHVFFVGFVLCAGGSVLFGPLLALALEGLGDSLVLAGDRRVF